MSTILQSMIDQAEKDARWRAAQAVWAEETERNKQVAAARARMEEALAPELWRELGIDLDDIVIDGAPTVAGEFDLAGHAMIASAEAMLGGAIHLRIILAANATDGRMIDREQLVKTEINGRADYRQHNTQRVAESLRAAIALAPDARSKMAARVRTAIDGKIGAGCYRIPNAGHIDRTRAQAIKDEIARARAILDDGQVASLRRELYRFAVAARRAQAEDRARRDRQDARAQALAAITEAARQYAPIYAQYEQAAHDWAQEATNRAWANIPARELWTVRYGRVIQEADEDGEVYRSAPEEIVTMDKETITDPRAQYRRFHTVRRVEIDGTTTPITISNVIDLTPYRYGDLTLRGAMAYCTTYAAQPAGYYVNVPGSSAYYRPPAPPMLSETWHEFCERTTGRSPQATWRAYLDDAETEALDIPF